MSASSRDRLALLEDNLTSIQDKLDLRDSLGGDDDDEDEDVEYASDSDDGNRDFTSGLFYYNSSCYSIAPQSSWHLFTYSPAYRHPAHAFLRNCLYHPYARTCVLASMCP